MSELVNDVAMMDAAELVQGYRAGDLSPVQATEAALERIERLDHRVRAMVLVDAEGAMTAARESAQRWADGTPLGPADGVPTTIKDVLLVRGQPTRRGSALTAGEALQVRGDRRRGLVLHPAEIGRETPAVVEAACEARTNFPEPSASYSTMRSVSTEST